MQSDGKRVITYDVDKTKALNMVHNTWRFEQYSHHPSSLQVQKFLNSAEQNFIRSMVYSLEQRPILWHHAQGFKQREMVNSYQKKRISTSKQSTVFIASLFHVMQISYLRI